MYIGVVPGWYVFGSTDPVPREKKSPNPEHFLSRYFSGSGVASSCEKALDYYRRVATTVASEISFSGGATIQRVRLQVNRDVNNIWIIGCILYSSDQ